jgi:hypothetical protein
VTLNNIQRLCTGETPFVLGEVYGLRQWYWDATYRDLRGHNGYSWSLDGANEAACKKNRVSHFDCRDVDSPEQFRQAFKDIYSSIRLRVTDPRRVTHSLIRIAGPFSAPRRMFHVSPGQEPDWELLAEQSAAEALQHYSTQQGRKGPTELSATAYESIPPHDVTDPICTCGFYAYTDAQSLVRNSYSTATATEVSSVFGLVKAYGLVTQGTKGFRAQKAQIVAATHPLTFQRNYGSPGPTFGEGSVLYSEDRRRFLQRVPEGVTTLPSLSALLDYAEPYLENSRVS